MYLTEKVPPAPDLEVGLLLHLFQGVLGRIFVEQLVFLDDRPDAVAAHQHVLETSTGLGRVERAAHLPGRLLAEHEDRLGLVRLPGRPGKHQGDHHADRTGPRTPGAKIATPGVPGRPWGEAPLYPRRMSPQGHVGYLVIITLVPRNFSRDAAIRRFAPPAGGHNADPSASGVTRRRPLPPATRRPRLGIPIRRMSSTLSMYGVNAPTSIESLRGAPKESPR